VDKLTATFVACLLTNKDSIDAVKHVIGTYGWRHLAWASIDVLSTAGAEDLIHDIQSCQEDLF
jgi:hypothetical protein